VGQQPSVARSRSGWLSSMVRAFRSERNWRVLLWLVSLAEGALAQVRVPRWGRGRPRSKPRCVIADRAYDSVPYASGCDAAE
jgi:hypothetical protein